MNKCNWSFDRLPDTPLDTLLGTHQGILLVTHLATPLLRAVGMKLPVDQRAVRLLVQPQAQECGNRLPVTHPQGLLHLDGTHLVMPHQVMEAQLPVCARTDGMKLQKRIEVK